MTNDSQATTASGPPVTFINVFEIDESEIDGFITGWEKRVQLMAGKPGFIDSRLHRARSADSRFQLVNVSHWESEEAYQAATADPAFSSRTQAARDDAKGTVAPNPALYDVAVAVTAP
ncbi:antibiotic biosynthesis monooxygenase family protein [Streptomyces sp. NPDC041068]|uniref:antibiotic biosynthesis monooxygenase family protein n=1 Tax=Streptomyces sp. NPDC041068 TaxID=3155130 RepID=UPI0033E74312